MKFLFYNLGVFLLQFAVFTSVSIPKRGHAEMVNNKLNTPPLTVRQSNQVKEIIRKYLQENPEVIIDSVENLRKRQKDTAKERSIQNLTRYKELILNDPTSPVAGNPKGDVTVVEFFDYSCGYCKRIFPNLKKLINDDKNIRFVFKELPILSPQSELAARAALAAWRQDRTKYIEIHSEFMNLKGRFSETRVLRIAKNKGLNVNELTKDMNSVTIDNTIKGNRQLAQKLNITGTPGFIIGNNIIPGAVKLETLKKIIADVRKNKVAG